MRPAAGLCDGPPGGMLPVLLHAVCERRGYAELPDEHFEVCPFQQTAGHGDQDLLWSDLQRELFYHREYLDFHRKTLNPLKMVLVTEPQAAGRALVN